MLEQLIVILLLICGVLDVYIYIKPKLEDKQAKKSSLIKFIFYHVVLFICGLVFIVLMIGNSVDYVKVGIEEVNGDVSTIVNIAMVIFLSINLVVIIMELLKRKISRTISIISLLALSIFVASWLLL